MNNFPKRIVSKLNVIAWANFELAYYKGAVWIFNHYLRDLFQLWLSIGKTKMNWAPLVV